MQDPRGGKSQDYSVIHRRSLFTEWKKYEPAVKDNRMTKAEVASKMGMSNVMLSQMIHSRKWFAEMEKEWNREHNVVFDLKE